MKGPIVLAREEGITDVIITTPTPLDALPELPPSERVSEIAPAKWDGDDTHVPIATGKKPVAFVEHKWGSGGGRGSQPDWMNSGSENSRTCSICGVTEKTESLIRADRKGMKYHYADAFGIQMTSMVPLGCPTFIGDTNGTLAETKQRVRGLDGKMETTEARLDRLEKDNLYLRSKLEEKIEVDVTGFVQWLSQVAAIAKQNGLPATPIAVNGLPYEVPQPIADMIIDVAAEPVLVTNDSKDR